MNYKQRIEEALNDETLNVSFLSRLPDIKLEKKLAIVHEQMSLAESTNNTDAIELLKTWERQIIEARVIKHEQQPELNELSEIEMELAELEAMEKVFENRMQVLEKIKEQRPKSKEKEEQNEIVEDDIANKSEPIEINQLKLF